MASQLSRSVFLAFLAITTLSCANIFTDMSVKDTDRAKFFQAKMYNDQSRFTDAITTIGTMTASGQAARETKNLLASAYAGRCGVDTLRLLDGMENSGSTRLFGTLLSFMSDSTTATLDDCISAETILASIGDESERTVNENLAMAMVQLGKVGAILNIRADTNDDNSFTTGGDAAFDACANGSLPESDTPADKASADQLVYSISVAVKSMTEAGTELAGNPVDALSEICSLGTDYCDVNSSDDVTSAQRTAIRGAVRENESVGLGICTGNALVCACGT